MNSFAISSYWTEIAYKFIASMMDPLINHPIKLENDEDHPNRLDDVCQACATTCADLKNMTEMYNYDGNMEVYSVMLEYCFSINVSENEKVGNVNMICESCIKRLRGVVIFKRQVETAQESIKLCLDGKTSFPSSSLLQSQEDDAFDFKCNYPGLLPSDSNDNFFEADSIGDSHLPPKDNDQTILNGKSKVNIIPKCEEEKILSIDLVQCDNKTIQQWNEKRRIYRAFQQQCNKMLKTENGNVTEVESPIKITLDSNTLYFYLNPNKTKCSVCDLNCDDHNHLKRHFNVHLPDLICDKCGSAFRNVAKLLKHRDKHFPDYEFTCPKCPKVHNTEKLRNGHVWSMHRNKPRGIRCKYCGEIMKSHSIMKKHLMEVHHKTEDDFKCEFCGVILTLFGLKKHIKRVHEKVRTSVCDVCGKSFFCQNGLIKHKLSHNGIRKFPCQVCGKSYLKKYTLDAHKLIHSDVKRFVCVECGQGFTYKCSLKNHIASHHQPKEKNKKPPALQCKRPILNDFLGNAASSMFFSNQ